MTLALNFVRIKELVRSTFSMILTNMDQKRVKSKLKSEMIGFTRQHNIGQSPNLHIVLKTCSVLLQ